MEKKTNTTKDKSVNKTAPNQSKRRSVVSYNNLSPELLAILKDKYPKGYADYMGEIFKVDKPDGSFFYAISLEVPDAVYLVKVDVKIDDYEEAADELFGGGSSDVDGADSDEFPEDDTAGSFAEESEDSDE
ncbi:MAG: hypothetical protein PHV12_06455 [Bacteroidales bacterium]|jgi:hypothetical protein|nr:hypothetical protein [Bacteroidales bacterium]MDD3272425.1 hypothetical protein [Bacteroidales bacterium]MDD4057581.1 hypothetical protein [Bacteroidales bacterium]